VRRPLIVVLSIVLAFSALTASVNADVPNTVTITRRTDSGNTIIDVKIRHSDPTTSHYISQINLDLDGTVKPFTDLVKATTTEATYSLNIGSANPNLVRAQPICNLHGAGPYYSEGGAGGGGGGPGIPAYPMEAMIVGALMGAAILIFMRKWRAGDASF
jgi:desulfoferrodoxin (superoxide reductase-like protein)